MRIAATLLFSALCFMNVNDSAAQRRRQRPPVVTSAPTTQPPSKSTAQPLTQISANGPVSQVTATAARQPTRLQPLIPVIDYVDVDEPMPRVSNAGTSTSPRRPVSKAASLAVAPPPRSQVDADSRIPGTPDGDDDAAAGQLSTTGNVNEPVDPHVPPGQRAELQQAIQRAQSSRQKLATKSRS